MTVEMVQNTLTMERVKFFFKLRHASLTLILKSESEAKSLLHFIRSTNKMCSSLCVELLY